MYNSLISVPKINNIPKIIWSFWHDSNNIPDSVKICINSWKIHNPDYNIILIDNNNYNNYINIPDLIIKNKLFNDSKARFSDLIRIYILYKYGGIWMDSSILLFKSLNNLINVPKDFIGYYLDGFTEINEYKVIESWFFACSINNDFVKKWRNEFTQIINYNSIDEYLNSRKSMGVDFQKINSPNYLAIHIAAQKVLQIDKYPINNLYLRKAEDGPYYYLKINNWDSNIAIKYIFNNINFYKNSRFSHEGSYSYNNIYDFILIKFRGVERNILDDKYKNLLLYLL